MFHTSGSVGHLRKQHGSEAFMKGNPTLNDVTEMADVSIATVSRVLNQNGYISSENRLKIEAAITTPGYRGRSSNKTFKRKKAG